jgi:hypothetical protein
MKSENFNLIINALDDKALYQEICKKIKDTDAISFRLLGWVPLLSGLSILTLCSMSELLSFWLLMLTGIFGALISYFIFRWEKRNRQMNDTFRSYAEILEAKKIQLENDDLQFVVALAGPYSLLRSKEKPRLWISLNQIQGWGKTEAESAIYGTTILFWLLLPLLALFN